MSPLFFHVSLNRPRPHLHTNVCDKEREQEGAGVALVVSSPDLRGGSWEGRKKRRRAQGTLGGQGPQGQAGEVQTENKQEVPLRRFF